MKRTTLYAALIWSLYMFGFAPSVSATLDIISPVAGGGSGGATGDGGAATQAALSQPTGVFVDGSGIIYIADRDNNRIRKVDTSGVITTAAGITPKAFPAMVVRLPRRL